LWVWLAFALLACGAIGYVAAASIIEYFIAAATWSRFRFDGIETGL
jgi:hypothetical protein